MFYYNTYKDKWSINELMTMCVQEEERLIMEESRARFNRVPFNEISVQDNVLLVIPFGEKEVSKVV